MKLKKRNDFNKKYVLIAIVILLISSISFGFAYMETKLNIGANVSVELEKNDYSIFGTIISNSNPQLDTGIDFTKYSSDTNGKGLYIYSGTENDEYPIYYYRGEVSNNNVIFANHCWKIVRTTETGGTKLLYNGKLQTDNTCGNTGKASQFEQESVFNKSYNNVRFMSYTYGSSDIYGTTPSTIKGVIDTWYEENIENNSKDLHYGKYLEDTIWCVDRSGPPQYSGLNYYGMGIRIWINKEKPIVTCPQKEDSYTVKGKSYPNGNELLDYPIALLTGDEAILAGTGYSKWNEDSKNPDLYISNNLSYWLLSPSGWYGSYSSAVTSCMGTEGALFDYTYSGCHVNYSHGVRPSVSLIPGIKVKKGGDGSEKAPYILESESIEPGESEIEKIDVEILGIKESAQLDTRINFLTLSSDTNGKGLYIYSGTEDDEYPIYYYRGEVSNNNVIFANHCWKIVRTTETGGVKLIYNGVPRTGNTCNNTDSATEIGKSYFNSISNNVKYFGYMYGASGFYGNNSSNIKILIDGWYENYMENDSKNYHYGTYLEDTIWCADRYGSIGDEETGSNMTIRRYGYEYRTSFNEEKPIVYCPQKDDSYTTKTGDNNLGNKLLDYPIALLTGDEAQLAGYAWYGGTWTYNTTSYLYTASDFWLLSPARWYGKTPTTYTMSIGSDGSFFGANVTNDLGVRPSISLKKGVKVNGIGDGSVDSPYIIE